MKILSIIWDFFKEVDQKVSDFMLDHDVSPVFVKVLSVNILSFTMAQVHDVLGVAMTSLSIAYLLWRWRRDFKKSDTV